jgi:hypothetical protein
VKETWKEKMKSDEEERSTGIEAGDVVEDENGEVKMK